MTPREKAEELEGIRPTTVREAILFWMAKQGVIALALFALMAMVAWTGRYAVMEGIPNVVNQIQAGYEKMERSHREEREETSNQATATLEKLDSAVREQSKVTQELSRQIENMK